MVLTTLMMVSGLVALIYCISRSILDFRRGAYVWGAVGLISIASFWMVPRFFMQPEEIKIVPVKVEKIGE